MAFGPLAGIMGRMGGADVRRPGRPGAGQARRRGRHQHRRRPAAGPGRHRRAGAAERRRLRRRPGPARRRGPAVPRAARGRLTSGCSRTCRGCASSCTTPCTPTPAASRSTARRSSAASPRRCPAWRAASTRATRRASSSCWAAASSSRRRPRSSRWRCAGWRRCWRWSRAGSTPSSPRPPKDRLPGHSALAETMRRRRASGGPAEQTFATLVGLELRPAPAARRRARCGARWPSSTAAADRDRLWSHPDLLPTSDDLDEPLDFVARQGLDDELPAPTADDAEDRRDARTPTDDGPAPDGASVSRRVGSTRPSASSPACRGRARRPRGSRGPARRAG